jgi:hypothetical protein
MTSAFLASAAGVVVSLAFNYIPGLNTWFAKQTTEIKRLLMLAVLVLVALGAYGLSCAGWWPTVTCDEAGIKTLLTALFLAAVANQTAYGLSPQTAKVKAVKEARVK